MIMAAALEPISVVIMAGTISEKASILDSILYESPYESTLYLVLSNR